MVNNNSTLQHRKHGLGFLNLKISFVNSVKYLERKMAPILLTAIILFSSQVIFAQSFQLTGNIKDTDEMPLPGANISIKNTTKGTVSDLSGNYRIEVELGTVLVFSSIGYITEEIVVGSQDPLNVTMLMDITALSEVVVIGYGSVKKSDLTGSVSMLSIKETELQNNLRIENMLQGKAAGVVVTQNSGAPGSAAKVRIRGYASGGSPVYVIDGLIDANINAIDPSDIESMSILKDASAAAIYGSRGANGVILVKTKSGGTDGKVHTSAEYTHTFSTLANKMELLDPVSYMKVVNKKATEGNSSPIFTREEIDYVEENGLGTDWQDEIFRLAHSDNFRFSVAKGDEKSSYNLSLGARNDEGILINTDYARYNIRLNTRTKLTKTTEMTFNVQNSFEKTHNTDRNRDNAESEIVQAALAWSPNLPVINPETGDYQDNEPYGSTTRRNPVYLAKEENKYGYNNIFSGNLSLKQELFRYYNIKLYAAAQTVNVGAQSYNRYAPTSGNETSVSNGAYSSSNNLKIQGSAELGYNRTFTSNSNLSAIAVVESQYTRNNSLNFKITDPYTEVLGTYSANAVNEFLPGGVTYVPEGMLSYLGRVSYSFRNKYLATGSLRYDKSSRLPEEKQGDLFPSIALAYRLSDEGFMKQFGFIKDLKLRASYGKTGDVHSISAFQIQDLIKQDMAGYIFDGVNKPIANGYEDGKNRANPYLIWETSRQFNGGLDIVLFKGMLAVEGDYYIKYTDDAHFNNPAPEYLGGGSTISNLGVYKNSGVEVQATTKWIQKQSSNWSLSTTVSFNYNVSEVITSPIDTLDRGGQPNGMDSPSHIMIVGQPVGTMVGYEYIGLDENGLAQYRDRNNDGTLNRADRIILGNGNPDYTWGLNTTLTYKNLSLNIFINGAHGMQVYNTPKYMLYGGGSGVVDGTSVDLLESASFDKGGAVPALTSNFRTNSSLFLEDAGYVRINNVALAYDIPKSVLKNINLQVYASVNNLYVFTNYSGFDPETISGGDQSPGVDNGSFPLARAYNLGLKLNF